MKSRLENLKKGDEVIWVTKSYKYDKKGVPKEMYHPHNAEVVWVAEKEIRCSVQGGLSEFMNFNRQTGICIDGSEYGWIQLP